MLYEQQRRAAFRLFALKYQCKLFDLIQGTPYHRFIWGSQSSSIGSSVLNRVEACGTGLVQQLNERASQLIRRLMNYTVVQADNMRHH